jgi:hypothetical protein
VSARKSASQRGEIRPSRRRRYVIYGAGLGLWLTGAVWLIFHYFVIREGKFGEPLTNPEEEWLIFADAAFSFAAVWLFGLLWDIHVVRAWKTRWRRRSGGTLFGVVAWLTVSGLLLYHVVADTPRYWLSLLHWTIGLATLAVFLVHLLSKSAPRRGGAPGGSIKPAN